MGQAWVPCASLEPKPSSATLGARSHLQPAPGLPPRGGLAPVPATPPLCWEHQGWRNGSKNPGPGHRGGVSSISPAFPTQNGEQGETGHIFEALRRAFPGEPLGSHPSQQTSELKTIIFY